MVQIRVTPERLEEIASQFSNRKDETETMIQNLKSTMVNLDSEWDGAAQQDFYTVWEEQIPVLQKAADQLGYISDELKRIAQAFRDVDEQVV